MTDFWRDISRLAASKNDLFHHFPLRWLEFHSDATQCGVYDMTIEFQIPIVIFRFLNDFGHDAASDRLDIPILFVFVLCNLSTNELPKPPAKLSFGGIKIRQTLPEGHHRILTDVQSVIML